MFRLVSLTISLLIVIGAILAAIPSAAVQAQMSLPECPDDLSGQSVFPSPRFEQDATLFWVSRSSLWRSQNNGETWLQVYQYTSDPLPIYIRQFQMVAHPGDRGLTLYMGIDDQYAERYYFLRSDDTGATWQEVTSACSSNAPDCPNYSLRAAGTAPVLFQPRLWFVGWSTLPFGVARSLDLGLTWDLVWSETPAWEVVSSPDFDHDHTVFTALIDRSATLDTSLVISTDGGLNWQPRGEGLCRQDFYWSDLEISPGFAGDSTLLAGLYKNSLFISKDAGRTWHSIFPNGPFPICDYTSGLLSVLPRFAPGYPADPTIYVATIQGIYVSYDDGQAWTRLVAVDNILDFQISWRSMESLNEPDAPHLLSLNSVKEQTKPGAATWQVFVPQVTAQGAVPPARPYTLFIRAWPVGRHESHVYRSDNGGVTWQCMERPQVRRRAYLPLLRAGP